MRLMIVDDEQIIREGMSRLFCWQSLGYEVRTADGFASALELAKSWFPDVVVTDIVMPQSDGLALVRSLKESLPSCVCILISGYNEFRYAQEAIELGAFRYLLKPVEPQELLDTLQEAQDYVATRSREQTRFAQIALRYDESLPILREHFLRSLVEGVYNGKNIRSEARELGCNLDFSSYLFAALSYDDSREFFLRSARERAALDTANAMILEEFLEEIGAKAHCFQIKMGITGIIIGLSAQLESVQAFSVLQKALSYIQRYLEVSVSATVSSLCKNEAEIRQGYLEVLRLMEYRPIMQSGRVISSEQLRSASTDANILSHYQDALDRLCLQIRSANEEGVSEALRHIGGIMESHSHMTQHMLKTLLASSVVQLQQIMLETGGLWLSMEDALSQNTAQAFMAFLQSTAGRALNCVSASQQSVSIGFVEQAKEFMQKNFHRQELNLAEIAAAIFVSPAHLSHTFSQTEGISVVDYLTHLRIDRAKLLLRESNLKSYEIALKVGYRDPQYFSTCFRKLVGVPPTVYRELISVKS